MKATIRPVRAIKIICRICNGGEAECRSNVCALRKKDLRIMEKIKQHCINCAPAHVVDECSGRIIGAQAKLHIAAGCVHDVTDPHGTTAICPLYPYRYGKNPNRARVLSDEQKERLVAAGAAHRFKV